MNAPAGQLLRALKEARARFTCANGELRVHVKASKITPGLVREINSSKPALLALLRADPTRCLHCLGQLEPHRIATCDACLVAQAERRQREVGR